MADKPTTTPSKQVSLDAWQWDGSTDPTKWPAWMVGCSATADDHALSLSAPQGRITVAKGEWIAKDADGKVSVTKDNPKKPTVVRPASGVAQSSPQDPDSAA